MNLPIVTGRPWWFSALKSPVLKALAIIVLWLSVFSIGRQVSDGFRWRADFSGVPITLSLPWSLVLSALSVCILVAAVWAVRPTTQPRWRRVELTWFLAILALVLLVGSHYLRDDVLLTTASSVVALSLVGLETVARLRDRHLGFVWIPFFAAYPPRRRVLGALVALVLVANLLLIWHLVTTGAAIAMLGIPAFLVCATAYLCQFTISLAAEYASANAASIAAERFKTELITNVSHDIRTPLTSIISYVDLLKKTDPADEKTQQYLRVLDRKSNRLAILITDLIEASKSATGNVVFELKKVGLSEMVGQACGEFEDQFSARNLALVLRSPPETISVLADPALLWRVLENILTNCIKYSLPGTRVFVELRNANRPVLILSNTSEKPIDVSGETLTEQFIRGDQARSGDGSGLGLYIARNFMEAMDGRFTVTAKGDLFSVTLEFPTDEHPRG